MPLVVKGGVWKNTEDEILKAAVSKYGMNQWARISSLLVRKTPKQCKARWYEWLDPSIKKTEWSKEEDEKLLHLAKLMPTQWRTISTVVGRTATQCLERYQKLLDEAEAREQQEGGLGFGGPGEEASAAYDDVRKLRPGEIDPDPETRKALPDPVDMDEDEKEMLSEARARLANTQGKKAKRKARERQLDDSRRLANLQKRRELKAAGINTRLEFRRRGDMDYNADIPFEIKPAAGFYDTTEEDIRGKKEQGMIDISKVQANKRRLQEEDERRGKRQRKAVIPPQDDATAAEKRARRLLQYKQAEQLARRKPLSLPTPQVGDSELEEIVKMGLSGESVRGLIDAEGNEYSRGLLSDFSRVGTSAPVRTPMTPAARMSTRFHRSNISEDRLQIEARNLRAMTQTQSSLLGGENTPLHDSGTGFNALPQRDVVATPNPLATPLRPVNGAARPGTTPLRTPRDTLALNANYGLDADKIAMQKLRAGFASLPKPKNDFELVLPDDTEDEDVMTEVEPQSVEDREEQDRKLRLAREAEELAALNRRSQVLKRNLPRPKHLNSEVLFAHVNAATDSIQKIIAQEMTALILNDASRYPIPDTVPTINLPMSDFVEYSPKEMASAQAEIAKEVSAPPSILGYDSVWSDDEFIDISSIPPSIIEAKLTASAPQGNKLEKKLSLTLGGYQARQGTLEGKIKEVTEAIEQARIDLLVYRSLQSGEEVAAPQRMTSLLEEVEILERREREGQERYKKLVEMRTDLIRASGGVNGH
jgi:pre-mRNA-splicing factor CDC5/CEF1